MDRLATILLMVALVILALNFILMALFELAALESRYSEPAHQAGSPVFRLSTFGQLQA